MLAEGFHHGEPLLKLSVRSVFSVVTKSFAHSFRHSPDYLVDHTGGNILYSFEVWYTEYDS